MQFADYADKVQQEVTQGPPDQVTRNWGAMWNTMLSALYNPPAITAVYEHASLIVARWEFMGGLYRGSSPTSVADARAYADRFLRGYASVHNLSGLRQPGESEFFSIFRNKSLHGFTPAGVHRPVPGDVYGWTIGHQPAAHLHVNAGLTLQIDSATLQQDFTQSVADYAAYLTTNVDATFPMTPQERWKKGFWARFCPLNYVLADSEQEGRVRGLYP
jgi:hypothetical protein